MEVNDGAYASAIVTSHIKKEVNLHRPDTSEACRKARSCLCVFGDVTFSANGVDVMLGFLMFFVVSNFLNMLRTTEVQFYPTNWRHERDSKGVRDAKDRDAST